MYINWYQIIAQALETLVPIVISILGILILKYVKEKTDNQYLIDTVEEALYLVDGAVKSVNQTFVNALKDEGGFTKEKQAEAKKMCLETIRGLLSDSMKLAIEKTYGSLDLFLDTMVESCVLENKK